MLFVDESGDTRIPKQPHPDRNIFAFGGVVIHSRSWWEARAVARYCRAKHKLLSQGELKWRDMIRGTGAFVNLTEAQRFAWYQDLFERLAAKELVTGIVVVVHKHESAKRPYIQGPEDIYRRGFRYCLQRFLLYLNDHQDGEAAIVIADRRSPGQDIRLQRHYDYLMSGAERWVKTQGLSQLDRIVEGLLMQESTQSIGLQLADLVVSGVAHSLRRSDPAWIRAVTPVLRKSPRGDVHGYGLVVAS